MEVIRYAFCLFNFVFLVTGAALVGVGVWLLMDNRIVGNFIPNVQDSSSSLKFSPYLSISDGLRDEDYASGKITLMPQDSLPQTMIGPLGYVCIVFGTFVFFLSFLGYCGALQDSVCVLGGYSILLGVVFILEIIAIILFFVYKPTVEQTAKEQLLLLLNERYSAVTVSASEAKSRARILSHSPESNIPYHRGDNEEGFLKTTTSSSNIYGNYKDYPITNNNNNNNNDDNTFGRMDMTIQVRPENERDMTKNNFREVVLFTKIFDKTMKNFQCCGVNNYLDFRKDQLKPNTEIPESCCKYENGILQDKNCVYEPNELNSNYQTGCFSRVIESVTEYAILGAVIVGILQIVGIVFSACGIRMIYKNAH